MRETLSVVKDGMKIDWDVTIQVDDGNILVADVFRPNDDGRHPVLLATGPYGKGLPFAVGYPHQWGELSTNHADDLAGSTNKYQVWEYADPEVWVKHGYALVRVDTRGTGCSPGKIDFFSPRETRDLYEAIEWAGVQPWSSGKVGLLGISYLASNQWQVAALAPPHLAAICPWEGACDYYREYTHSGGIVSEFLPSWKPYQVDTVQYGNKDAQVNPNNGRRISGDVVMSEKERRASAIDIGRLLNEHPLDDHFYAERSAKLADVRVPLLSSSNWGGMALHSRGNFEGYVQAGSEKKWLEVHGLEHWTEFYTKYGQDLQLRFFDHFLKGADNGWDKQPPVQLKVRRVDEFVIRHENEWPIARTTWTEWPLTLSGLKLGGEADCDIKDVSFKARSRGIRFTSDPFSTETEITGPVALRLFVSSSTTDADIFATVNLLDPHGKEVLFASAFEPRAPVTQGWLRLSHRKTDPAKSHPWRPWHSHEEIDPLVPGEVYAVDIEIWPTSIVVPVGYRLALTIQGQDYDHGLPERSSAYGREQFGSGPYWHEHPGDRDKPEYDGVTTLVSRERSRPFLLIPLVPPKANDSNL
jgi:predicted acyl esterase